MQQIKENDSKDWNDNENAGDRKELSLNDKKVTNYKGKIKNKKQL